MFVQAADSLARWPATAIHDTVAVIIRQDAYQQRLSRSLADRLLSWFFDRLNALFDLIAGTPGARNMTLIATALVVAALALRVILSARYERRMPCAVRRGDRSVRSLPTFEEARRLAHEGRSADAMHMLYAAILDALSHQRLIRLHSSKTSGDFARELRGRGHPAYDAFRIFVRRFDRLFYGHDVVDAAAFDALWGDAERVVRAFTPSAAP